MADDLVGFQEGLGLLPDNVTREIDAIDHRRVALSFLRDRGGIDSDDALAPFTIPIPAVDVWVDIAQAMGAGAIAAAGTLFWGKDANGAAVYDYATDWPTVGVPPGYSRSVLITGLVSFDPDGNTWQFAIGVGGVLGGPWTVETANQTDAIVTSITRRALIDVSLAPPVSMFVRNTDNAEDLVLNGYGLVTAGGPLV